MAKSMINRSIQNRCLAAFLSVMLMIPTGWALWMYLTRDPAKDDPNWLSKPCAHGGMEFMALAFLCSIFGIIWAAFLPASLDRAIRFAADHSAWALAALLCVMLGLCGFAVVHTLLR